MSDSVLIKRESLVAMADAIREAIGKTQLFTLNELLAALMIDDTAKCIVERTSSSITIPEGATSIGSNVFYNWTSLTSITLPNSITSIDNAAFAGCTNLTTINVPWAEGAVSKAPWGATNAVINYNYTNS